MPILTLQKRAREIGRIRIGQVQPASNGKTRPAKLDRFRLTSASRPLLEKVAALYGGEVREWTPANGGPPAFEVLTTATRLPILVPPQPVTQWLEMWSGSRCHRRCDGETEVLSDQPCLCTAEEDMVCKPTTRLNVLLRDVEGIGVWRLESHGKNAAAELPQVAEFLAQAGGYVSAWLVLEERVIKRQKPDGGTETLRFMVPGIEVEGVTPGQLMAGTSAPGALGPGAANPALPAGGPRNYCGEIMAAASRDEVTRIWREAKDAHAPDRAAIEAACRRRVAELDAERPPAPAQASEQAAEPAGQEDPEEIWVQIVTAAGDAWTTSQLHEAFTKTYGGMVAHAPANHLREFLAGIKGGLMPAVLLGGPGEDKVPF